MTPAASEVGLSTEEVVSGPVTHPDPRSTRACSDGFARLQVWVSAVAAATGIVCAIWFGGLLVTASLPPQVPGRYLAVFEAVFAVVGAFVATRTAAAFCPNPAMAGAIAALAVVGLGAFPPVAGPLVPFVSLRWIIATAAGLVLGTPRLGLRNESRSVAQVGRRVGLSVIVVVATFGDSTVPAGAWIASARRKHSTDSMRQTGGVDLVIDTHQWFANQGIEILRADGAVSTVAFLDSPDPTAPTIPWHPGTQQNYRWRLLMGASDADGTLYPQIPDHFFNWWTHGGRQWIGGSSAATNAEVVYQRAIVAWQRGDRGTAMRWLGASVHLLTDACVPQHQFFSVNVYHHQFEAWVQLHQNELAVARSAIYRSDFRTKFAHGGSDWTSSHPRGWVDECAHRAAHQLQAATHSNPKQSKSTDPQWGTASLIADAQRFSAGYLAMFFEEVKGP